MTTLSAVHRHRSVACTPGNLSVIPAHRRPSPLSHSTHLAINANARTLIDERLPFQVRQRELAVTFLSLGYGILVVINNAGRPAGSYANRGPRKHRAMRHRT
jgi:hypothetical protein